MKSPTSRCWSGVRIRFALGALAGNNRASTHRAVYQPPRCQPVCTTLGTPAQKAPTVTACDHRLRSRGPGRPPASAAGVHATSSRRSAPTTAGRRTRRVRRPWRSARGAVHGRTSRGVRDGALWRPWRFDPGARPGTLVPARDAGPHASHPPPGSSSSTCHQRRVRPAPRRGWDTRARVPTTRGPAHRWRRDRPGCLPPRRCRG